MRNQVTVKGLDVLMEKAKKAASRLILLDFDGTLVDFTAYAANTVAPNHLLKLLQRIAEVSQNELIIITGRTQDDISRLIGHLPVGIIAEHGAVIREDNHWKTLMNAGTFWKKDVITVFDRFSIISPDSFLEEKKFSLAWHYRNVDKNKGLTNSRTLIKELQEVASQFDLRILDGKKVVEVISRRISKGFAARYVVNRKDYDFILALGDDITDEDMFRVFVNDKKAYTVKIGRGPTSAKFKLRNIQQVTGLLEQLLAVTS